MRTSNPFLNENSFSDRIAAGARMTLQGTVNKSFLLLAVLLVPALYVYQAAPENPGLAQVSLFGGLIAGLILALVTVFKKTWAPVTAPLYALAEGLFLGAISARFEAAYFPGIAIQAVLLTTGTFLGMLALYSMRIIKATENFKMGVAAATIGIFFVYLINIVLSFFGMQVPFLHDTGMIGIGISLFIVVIAALNLVLDFDLIESNCANGAPKYMESYCAFALLVTLVWLYLEMLRLLAKLRGRD